MHLQSGVGMGRMGSEYVTIWADIPMHSDRRVFGANDGLGNGWNMDENHGRTRRLMARQVLWKCVS